MAESRKTQNPTGESTPKPLFGEREESKPQRVHITFTGDEAVALRVAAYNLSMTPNQFVKRQTLEKLRGIGMLA